MPNTLFYGDNLEVLRRHVKDESVDLCYIDPPFNSNRDYFQIYNNIGQEDRAQAQAFTDTWTWDEHAIAAFAEIMANEGGRFSAQTIELMRGLKAVLKEGALLAYLVSMTLRIVEIHRALKPTGSFYLHCDPTASHYLKIVMDAIFVPDGGDYKSEIIWKRTSAHSSAKRYGPIHDVIFFYVKSQVFCWNQQFQPYDPAYVELFFEHKDPDGRRWKRADITGAGTRNGETGQTWRDINVTAKGRHWAYPPSVLELMDARGKIHWPAKKDGMPRLKQYFDEMPGIPLQDMWMDIRAMHNLAAERLGYPTQKPEALLERIIAASSNEGDVVLDAYCGCGTTISVAQRLKRQWIGIDITYQSIGVILKRLIDAFGKEVGDSVILSGIPRDMASARALANKADDRVRKEFEKWAVLTYSRHQAIINTKKGADKGVDGMQYFPVAFGSDEMGKVLYQVKSGGVNRSDIATLRGDMMREGAQLGVFLTLEESTEPMRKEANAAGTFFHPLMQKTYPVISIVPVREIVENGARLELPISHVVNKKAAVAAAAVQASLDLE